MMTESQNSGTKEAATGMQTFPSVVPITVRIFDGIPASPSVTIPNA
jgi:hypothetical protein